MNGLHDVRLPAGPQAAALAELWTIMLWVCVLVFVLAMAALAISIRRAASNRHEGKAPAAIDASRVSTLQRWIGGGVAASSLLLFGLLFASFRADRALAALSLQGAVHIDLTAHQFWWEARYEPHEPMLTFATANELHVPVGQPVLMRLRSDDVIHSFWVPSLAGKKDLIPGRETTLAYRADRAGVYRGQCAEFCGYQHAHMAIVVIAEPPDDYARWLETQRRPAVAPSSAEERRGRDLVEQTSCAMCHAINGTRARGQRAPDLTHLATRGSLGAGVLPNTYAARIDWVNDPHRFKPGVNMPPLTAAPSDLAAISAYLGALR